MSLGRRGSARLPWAAVALAATVALVAGCGEGDPLSPRTDPHALRAPDGWELLEIEGPDGTVEPAPGPRGVPSLRFTDADAEGEGRRLEGDGGCNLGGGVYDADDDGSLEIHQLVWTAMACLEPGVMEVEGAFFEALSTVRSFRVEAGQLVLQLDGGSMTLVAAEAD